jgi:hypothetical protein
MLFLNFLALLALLTPSAFAKRGNGGKHTPSPPPNPSIPYVEDTSSHVLYKTQENAA